MTWNKISNEELNLSQIMENVKNNFKNGGNSIFIKF